MQPTILLLNGTSSSGKTTISRYFQQSVAELWLVVSLDSFLEMFPPKMSEDWPPFSQLCRAYYETTALWARSGYNLVVDTVIDGQDDLLNCVRNLAVFRVYTVGLHCSMEELSRRAKTRANREAGLIQRQLDTIHKLMKYDLELDTATLTVEQCASKIVDMLRNSSEPTAFRTLSALVVPGR